MCHAEGIRVLEAVHGVFQQGKRFSRLELFADREEVFEVPSLHKLHDDVVLMGSPIKIDRQDADDIDMVQRQADLPFALEQVDRSLLLAPATAQDFDGNDHAGIRIVRAEHATEAARLDSVEKTIAAQEVTVDVPLGELVRLPRRQKAFALQRAQELVGVDARLFHFDTDFAEHRFAEQTELNCLLGESIRVRSCHERHDVPTDCAPPGIAPWPEHPFYNVDSHFQAIEASDTGHMRPGGRKAAKTRR